MGQETPPANANDVLASPRLEEALRLLNHPLVRDEDGKYRPWRKFRPIARDAGLNPDVAWIAAKWRRMSQWQRLPLQTAEGRPFVVAFTPALNESLHRLDRETGGGGSIAVDRDHGVLGDEESRRRFLIRSMMDEAIDSSIIEGARTSLRVARELLRTGRVARDKSEQMVVNNYRAMRLVKGWLDRPLSVPMLLEIQKVLTEGVLEEGAPPDASGRMRQPDEPVVVEDRRTQETVFTPPRAEDLPRRLEQLCDFANTPSGGELFIHPVLRACILHFMIGYEHPFCDGNGRTARAVFYWSSLRSGYRIFEFMSISALIQASPAAYPQAYIDTESDDADLTYFVLYKMGVIRRSLDQLGEFLSREEVRVRTSHQLLRADPNLNLRQRLLLEHAMRHPTEVYTARTQAETYGVSLMTGRADLEYLARRKFLRSYKVGKAVHYVLADDASRRLVQRAGRRSKG